MKNRIATLLTTALLALSCICPNTILPSKAESEAPAATFICSPSKLVAAGFSIDDLNDFDAQPPTPKVKDTCDKLKFSCCNDTNFNILLTRFAEAKITTAMTLIRYKQAAKLFAGQKESLKPHFEAASIATVQQCMDDLPKDLDVTKALTALEAGFKGGEKLLLETVNKLLEFHSGFGCEVCGPRFNQIKFENDSISATISPHDVEVALANIKAAYELLSHMLDIELVQLVLACKAKKTNAVAGHKRLIMELSILMQDLSAIDPKAVDYKNPSEGVLKVVNFYGLMNVSHLPRLLGLPPKLLEETLTEMAAKKEKMDKGEDSDDEESEIVSDSVGEPKKELMYTNTSNIKTSIAAGNKSAASTQTPAPTKQPADGTALTVKRELLSLGEAYLKRHRETKNVHFFINDMRFFDVVDKKLVTIQDGGMDLAANPMNKSVWQVNMVELESYAMKLNDKSNDKPKKEKSGGRVLLWVGIAVAVAIVGAIAFVVLRR